MLRMKKLACVLAVVALSGCASIANDKTQQIKIVASNGQQIQGSMQEDTVTTKKQDGKHVKVHNKTVEATFSGSTNAVSLERSGKDKVVVVENPECTKETPVKRSVSPMFFGNVLIGGLLGSTTDASTGKMWQYQEDIIVNCK